MSETPGEQANLSPEDKRHLLGRLLKQRAETGGRSGASSIPYSPPADGFDPFPLRDIQQAYWIGRSKDFELGNVGAHVYVEFDSPTLDVPRLNAALDALIARHDMLRSIVLPSGQQRILESVPPSSVAILDLSRSRPNAVDPELLRLRDKLSHRVFVTDHWPLFELRLTNLPERRMRIHFGVDLLIADLRSIYILLSEWFQLYADPSAALPPIETSFREYVLKERALEQNAAFARAEAYWRAQIPKLPPAPELPLAKAPSSIGAPRFTRRTKRIAPAVWLQLKEQCEAHHVTPSSVLLSAFGCSLATWSRAPRFTIDVTIFNRHPFHPHVHHLVGDFTSVILIPIDFAAPESFAARCASINERLWDALDHREFSGVRVLRELLRQAGGAGRAIMPVVFTCDLRHDMVSIKDSWSAVLPGEVAYGVSQTPQVYLDHQVFEESGGLTINWDAVEDVFPPGMLDDMLDANLALLERLARDPQSWRHATISVTPISHRALAESANATDAAISVRLLHELFDDQAALRPDAPAVASIDCILTYGELLERANRLGRRLRNRGVRPNTLVAVVMEKGWEQVVAVLGILKSGAAYLPIDPDLPAERLQFILAHGEVRIALIRSRDDRSLTWPSDIERIAVDMEATGEDAKGADSAPLAPQQRPDDLAYVIYTSGSTGAPKGVMIDHRGAVNTILDINDRFAVGPTDRVLALSSLSFDLSVYDVFGPLAAGGTVVLPDPSSLREPADWVTLIECERVTIWNTVPMMMEMLIDYAMTHRDRSIAALRLVLLSGDWIPVTLPDRIKSLIRDAAVVSLGGATEASIWSILHSIEKASPDWESVPYGKAMRNQRFFVLDEALEVRPVGVPGELYIGGIGLAKGYWRDDEKTAARFVIDPRTCARLYRTGDWGSYLPDGAIKFLGRDDLQVKVQGHRVELGEIEAALTAHPSIRVAVATAIGETRGAKRLVAHVVCREAPAPTDKELKDFLRGKLPSYMVPGAIVALDRLPLTPNGKVDRGALQAPLAQTEKAPAEEPSSPMANRVSGIIERALQVERIDMHASLLDLGVNSLDMLRIGNQLEQEFGSRPTIQEFVRFENLMALVDFYERSSRRESATSSVSSMEAAPADAPWRSFALLVEPAERMAFKTRQHGHRRVDESANVVRLPRRLSDPDLDQARVRAEGQATVAPLLARRIERRTRRTFDPRPLTAAQLGGLLDHLAQATPHDVKREYASAGGLYPVQTYLHVKDGRVEGVDGGVYYYDPRHHRLALLTRESVDRAVHWPENRRIFDHSAFSVLLIAQLGAVAPLYQERSLHFATIEAGLISQLLETSSHSYRLALCQIGDLDFARVRRLFALDEGHVLVHSLLGGLIDEGRTDSDQGSADLTVVARPPVTAATKSALVVVNSAALDADAVLDGDIRASAPVATAAPAQIFLTGATGFLGAFLLDELLRRTSATVHCLVRASSPSVGAHRLRESLERFGLWTERSGARVVPVLGDLSEPLLGLGADRFSTLAGVIDVIYHSGALVKLMRPYGELNASNVGGTHEVLRLASAGRTTPVHLVSSVAVFPFDGGRIRRETDPLDHGEDLLGGYAQTKWVAEKLAVRARERGIPVTIYRPGTITGHSRTGASSTDSYLSNLIRGCIELGSAPDVDALLDMVPVDFVAAAIVSLSRSAPAGNVFHLTNPSPMPMSALISYMDAAGFPLRRVGYEAWRRELFALGDGFLNNALFPFGDFIAMFTGQTMLGPRYECDAALQALRGTTVACPPVDHTLLTTYFTEFVGRGLLAVNPSSKP